MTDKAEQEGSDTEMLTRKLPGGAKVIAKAAKVATTTTKRAKTSKATVATTSTTVSTTVTSTGDTPISLETLERDTMGEDWYKALSAEFDKKYFKTVSLCQLHQSLSPQ